MTDFTECVEVDGSGVPGASRRFTMEQLEFAGWWDRNHPARKTDGRDLLSRVLSQNGEWVSVGDWRFRRKIV